MKVIRFMSLPELPRGWAWLNNSKLGSKPNWIACPWPHDGESWEEAMGRVVLHCKSWSGSPDNWLSGKSADLADLTRQGFARKTGSGWYVPTKKFLACSKYRSE